MVLVVDIGNTNIKMGVFESGALIKSWRLTSMVARTADEYGLNLIELLKNNNISPDDIEGVVMSSVIPNLNYTMEHMFGYYFNKKPLVLGPGVKTGLKIKYDNPRELGSDRIAVSVAALKDYGGPLITMDFGTATSINVLTADKEFLGGVICPGVKASAEGLQESTARLPKFELAAAPSVLGKNTVSNMQSGIFYGFIGMAEYLVRRIKDETGLEDAKVVATGGLSEFLRPGTELFDHIDRRLSLKGLYYIYKMNT